MNGPRRQPRRSERRSRGNALIDLAVGAKRYDGGSGSAVFSGVIPLKPGQLFESALETVSLWDGTQEIGVTPSALWPQHPDGSMKVVQIAATLGLASGVQKDLTLRLGTTRLVSGPTQPDINHAWMRAPRLIGCTSAAHLCASRISILPLVPIPNANLPEQWNTFLTTEWDDNHPDFPSWGRVKDAILAETPGAFGGTANYDALQPLYCKYLTSGELDRLYYAHLTATQSFPLSVNVMMFIDPKWSAAGYEGQEAAVVFYGEDYDGHAKDSLYVTKHESDYHGHQPPSPGADGNSLAYTEVFSGVHLDLYTCYALSGWPQARDALVQQALVRYGGTAATPFPGPRIDRWNSSYGAGRFDWRFMRGGDYLYALLAPPMALYWKYVYGTRRTIPSPRTHRADHIAWLVDNNFNEWADTNYSRAYPTNSVYYDSWWGWPGGNGVPGDNVNFEGLHIFQLAVQLATATGIYQNFIQDDRVRTYITKSAALLERYRNGPIAHTNPANPMPSSYGYYYADIATNRPPANGTDFIPNGPNYPFQGVQLNMFYVLAHQLTGNTAYRDLADFNASKYRFCLPGGYRAGSAGWKEMGECWSLAFYAAAYRAGVPLGEWEISGPQPPPPPPPPPGEFMATLNLSITNQVQDHLVDYTGVRVRFQRSTDGGVTYADVQSAVRALGTTTDQYLVPAGQSGHYRAGAALTDGTAFGTEVFSSPIQVAVFSVLTPQTITLAISS